MTQNKKLIEVSLPLEAINRESAREKSIRHGHPSTLHLYWARRPLATARAILFSQLVDDPSSNPEQFPTVEDQDKERLRLHGLIERLVNWDNLNDDALFNDALEEILSSNGGNVPRILDPFAGGGSIPIEAQRLGLLSTASDLNPLAVALNKSLLVFPARFSGQIPIYPGLASSQFSWRKTEGLAADIQHYGKQLRELTEVELGAHYPEVSLPGGVQAKVIAWIWARTVQSPNPANPIMVPLVRSWWLSKKKGNEAYIQPYMENGQVKFTVNNDQNGPSSDSDGTIGRRGGFAVGDGTPISLDYVRKEGRAGRIGKVLMAMVVEGPNGRLYLPPTSEHEAAANVVRPLDVPVGSIPTNPRDFKTPNYGLTEWSDLFSDRQIKTLVALSDNLTTMHSRVLHDGLSAGLPEGEPLESGGAGARAYADAICVYLALAIGRTTDYGNALNSWSSTRETIRNLFARQAIPMVWDYAESNPFSSSTGNFLGQVDWVSKAVLNAPVRNEGAVDQANASTRSYQGYVISTDPPYYDNIGYADLSDFFYVWLRRSLLDILPQTLNTILTPKADELVADSTRHGSKAAAETFFVDGFNSVFTRIREQADHSAPITIYYAYKQQEENAAGTSSTGWHTLLSGLIASGWEITATWPVRSELANRMIGNGTNVLASSIVLACRPRPDSAEATTRRGFLNALRVELPKALRELMQGAIAPVDLAQAAIGPGISVFSRFSRVRENDGTDMSVKEALLLINAALDDVLNEQESDFDPITRFAVKWYKQYGWRSEASGIADQLARSSDTYVASLERGGIFSAKAGKARLISPSRMTDLDEWDPVNDENISIWECAVRLAGLMAIRGADAVIERMPAVESRVGLDPVKELGYLLFYEAEKNGDTQDAILFNGLVSAWSDLTAQSRRGIEKFGSASQMTFNFEDNEDGN
jgi:putative DNA methylase